MPEPERNRFMDPMPATSPFTPGFGVAPEFLAGRDALLDSTCDGLRRRIGTNDTFPMLIGPRGYGKTVLLGRIGQDAQEAGWVVLSASGTEGDPCAEFHRQIVGLSQAKPAWKVDSAGAQVFGTGASVSRTDVSDRPAHGYGDNFKDALSDLARGVDGSHSRVLLVLDEAHSVSLPQMRRLGAIVQQVASVDLLPVCMVAACLPVGLKTILQDRKSTFLRRMRKHRLELIADEEMADCFRRTIAGGGGTINDAALAEAVRGSGGHPYMLQLVGHTMWGLSQEARHIIQHSHAAQAVAQAEPLLWDDIFRPAWDDLSETDRKILACAAAISEGPVRFSEAVHMACGSKGQAGEYRARLLRTGFVQPAGRGHIEFASAQIRSWVLDRIQAGELGSSVSPEFRQV